MNVRDQKNSIKSSFWKIKSSKTTRSWLNLWKIKQALCLLWRFGLFCFGSHGAVLKDYLKLKIVLRGSFKAEMESRPPTCKVCVQSLSELCGQSSQPYIYYFHLFYFLVLGTYLVILNGFAQLFVLCSRITFGRVWGIINSGRYWTQATHM